MIIISIFMHKIILFFSTKKKNQLIEMKALEALFLQDLVAAAEKMNSRLRNKGKENFFHQHELESLELGMCFPQMFLPFDLMGMLKEASAIR